MKGAGFCSLYREIHYNEIYHNEIWVYNWLLNIMSFILFGWTMRPHPHTYLSIYIWQLSLDTYIKLVTVESMIGTKLLFLLFGFKNMCWLLLTTTLEKFWFWIGMYVYKERKKIATTMKLIRYSKPRWSQLDQWMWTPKIMAIWK